MSANTTDPGSGSGQGVLVDRYDRVATDLRVSLTDRCNLRCTYCMPEEGLAWLKGSTLLSREELLRLIRIGVEDLGIKTVRLTGGEPLLRPDLEEIVAAVARMNPRPQLALTTNGIGLAARAEALAEAGLDRINISLDTLDRETFRRLSRRDRLEDVLAGVRAARRAALDPVKINTVLMRGINDTHAVALLDWALAEGVQLRFIEQMPLDAQHRWRRSDMVTAAEIKERLETKYELIAETEQARGSAPAELFKVANTPHVVGIVAAVTKPFCGACDRVRLTVDGQVRNCLFSRTESDLRTPLRAGADDAELARRWMAAVAAKLPGHGINDPTFLQPDRPMSAIGG